MSSFDEIHDLDQSFSARNDHNITGVAKIVNSPSVAPPDLSRNYRISCIKGGFLSTNIIRNIIF